MARNRMIKPGFWTSEQLAECSRDARLIFIGIWNFCDDGGVHPASAKRVKMEVLPGDDVTVADVQTWVDELVAQDLLRSFSHNGAEYWYVTGWGHQRIDRPSYSYPGPHNEKDFVDAMASAPRIIDEQSTNARPQRKGSEVNARSANARSEVNGSEGKTELPKPNGSGESDGPAVEQPDDRFDEFWAAYPRKEGKKRARTAWRNLSKTKREAALADCATRYRQTEKQFIPHPTTYLHEERWNDEPVPVKKTHNFGLQPVDNSAAAEEAKRRFRERQGNADH